MKRFFCVWILLFLNMIFKGNKNGDIIIFKFKFNIIYYYYRILDIENILLV